MQPREQPPAAALLMLDRGGVHGHVEPTTRRARHDQHSDELRQVPGEADKGRLTVNATPDTPHAELARTRRKARPVPHSAGMDPAATPNSAAPS